MSLFKKKNKRPNAEVAPQRVEPLSQKSKGDSDSTKGNFGTGALGAVDTSLVLKGAHVTEKAGLLNGINQYVFKVASRSNKIEIKKAVEKMYGVKVDQVRISIMPAKKRKLGRQEGEKAGFKKAMVKLAVGNKIDIMPK